MNPEMGIWQRAIVGKRIVFEDSEVDTKYTLPFVDATWEVPFVLIDRLGAPPRMLAAKIHFDGRRMHTPSPVRALRPIESMPAGNFGPLVHFDPCGPFEASPAWIPRGFRRSSRRTSLTRFIMQARSSRSTT